MLIPAFDFFFCLVFIRISAMQKSLSDLEILIDYRFKDVKILERALTHRSWANEKGRKPDTEDSPSIQNERLEFVGDSVLGLTIAVELYTKHPDLSEGDLTLMKHHLVSSETLAIVAEELKLGKFIKMGRGEEKTGGRKKQAMLADTLEAVIAAVFFDGGYIRASKFVVKLFSDEIKKATPEGSLDYKTLLQETLQGEKREAPNYEVVKKDGPSHDPVYTVRAAWDSGSAEGKGKSIKSAEMEAASAAIRILDSGIGKQTEKV